MGLRRSAVRAALRKESDEHGQGSPEARRLRKLLRYAKAGKRLKRSALDI